MLDLEREYDNRGRVPEHPAHIAGWARDAQAYRDAADSRSIIDVAYGGGPRQRYDIFLPETGAGGPVAMFIHGGYWQALSKSSFSHMAAGPNALGITVAVVGYTLCPDASLSDIVDEIRMAVISLVERFGRPVVVYGHSAGGHLAACMLASDWSELHKAHGFDPVPAALPVSGLFDLVPLTQTTVNGKLGLNEAEARRLSPLFWAPPAGRRAVAVVGADESSEYLRQTRELAAHWGGHGVFIRAVETAGDNHFTVIGPFADADSDLTRGLAALAQG